MRHCGLSEHADMVMERCDRFVTYKLTILSVRLFGMVLAVKRVSASDKDTHTIHS